MWEDALLLMFSCTLFVQMGLSDAIQHTIHLRFRILSCPKCASFWVTLIYLIASGCRVVESVAASFLFSYLSLWLALGYDMLAELYNTIYEQFFKTSGATENAATDSSKATEAPADELPEV